MKSMNMNILFGGIIVALLLVSCSQSSNTDNATPGNGGPQYPAQLKIPSTGTNGIFDASLAQDPSASRVWMSYSSVSPSVMWPTGTPDAVETRLAYSDTQGETWFDAALLIPYTDVDLVFLTQPPFNLDASFRAGTWQSEVSSLVFDASATDPNQKWKLLSMHYLAIKSERHFEHGWIGLKMAATPQELATATEIKLFSSATYDPANNTIGGPSGVPVDGAPAIAFDTAISTELNGCLIAEPGIMSTASALYLSVDCIKSATDTRVVLLKCTNPCNMTSVNGSNGWTYVGTSLTKADGDLFGADQGFTASNLVQSNGQNYLIVTPRSSTPSEGYYNGCKVFRFSNIDAAALQRTDGVPDVVTTVNGDVGSFGGACTYLPSASKAGVIRGQLFATATEKFRLFISGIMF